MYKKMKKLAVTTVVIAGMAFSHADAFAVLYCAKASALENAMPAMIIAVTANFFIFLYTNS